ncbi:hypothetical protein HK100_006084 [Physocladia obscura]|uniref:NSUN5/RCM1 N-terminal domain-containing protein n=1 Tax=Physocladia obscura TaxID=109957 RepID=A0AAD5SSY6_9FUNG|nr:hypothetical protein HK100_006084 [Physocladia obscura]
MPLHATCARVVEQCLANTQRLSLRRLVDGACGPAAPDKERRAVFAVVCQVLKFKAPLRLLIAAAGMPPSAAKGRKAAVYLVLVYELLFGSGLKSAPSSLRALVVPHKTRLTAELAKLKMKKRAIKNEDLLPDYIKNAVVLPRYARVNTNVSTIDATIETLAKSGYKLIEYIDGMHLGKLA